MPLHAQETAFGIKSRLMIDRMSNTARNVLLFYFCFCACQAVFAQPGENPKMLPPPTPWEVMRTLSSDAFGGRGTAEPGGQKSRKYISQLYRQLDLLDLGAAEGTAYDRPLAVKARKSAWTDTLHGGNVCGMIRGSENPERYIVVTAHYDHLGEGRANSAYGKRHEGAIHNGADDNASGVAGVYALAQYFREHPPRHSIIFLATDGEELGLKGAKQWVSDPPVPLEQVLLNVNLDMVARADNGSIWAVGTRFHKGLRAPLRAAADSSVLELRFGRDARVNWVGNSWLAVSDHYPFHRAGVPFVYFGVDDHPDYHEPTDDIERIDRATFEASMDLIVAAVARLDAEFGKTLTLTEGKRRRIVPKP